MTKVFTKESLIAELTDIYESGWQPSVKKTRDDSAVGATLEHLLGIPENNLPLPNAADWELKAQALGTSSLTTLKHKDPSPRALRPVQRILLADFGWPHTEAGKKYPQSELSLRFTLGIGTPNERGFGLQIQMNGGQERLAITFDSSKVDKKHAAWLGTVQNRCGAKLDPEPYWGLYDLWHELANKLHNCFYVLARKRVNPKTNLVEFWYVKALMLSTLTEDSVRSAITSGLIKVDVDARTGHNHGTKFRISQKELPSLYAEQTVIFDHSDLLVPS